MAADRPWLAAGALLAAASLAGPAAGQALPRPLLAGSFREIVATHRQHPFAVLLWSLDCAPCRDDLGRWADRLRVHPGIDLVLVSTDRPALSREVSALLRRLGLAGVESWIFAAANEERLRAEIDPRWHGEVPRSYLYCGGRRLRSVSGLPGPQVLAEWTTILAPAPAAGGGCGR